MLIDLWHVGHEARGRHEKEEKQPLYGHDVITNQ